MCVVMWFVCRFVCRCWVCRCRRRGRQLHLVQIPVQWRLCITKLLHDLQLFHICTLAARAHPSKQSCGGCSKNFHGNFAVPSNAMSKPTFSCAPRNLGCTMVLRRCARERGVKLSGKRKLRKRSATIHVLSK